MTDQLNDMAAAFDGSAPESDDAGDESGYSSDKEDVDGLTTPESDEMPTDSSSGGHDESADGTFWDNSKRRTPSGEQIVLEVVDATFFPSSHQVSTGNNRGTDHSSLTSSMSSNSGSSRSLPLTDDDTSDDNKWNMRYLQKKRRLLKRATDISDLEEAYNASVARETAAATIQDSPLWREAKDLVSVLFHDGRKQVEAVSSSTIVRSPDRCRLENSPSPKKPRIDVSSVQHLSSRAVDNGVILPRRTSNVDCSKLVIPNTFYAHGTWMAKALGLLWRMPRQEAAQSTGERDAVWDVSMDPHSGVVSTLHQTVDTRNAATIEEAISCTPVAQMVAQPVPPFVVVHANRAFAVFSGTHSKDIIGRPVESIVQVVSDISRTVLSSDRHGEQWLDAALKLKKESREEGGGCKLRVIPVVMDSTGTENNRQAVRMSHVLVQVYPDDSSLRSAVAIDTPSPPKGEARTAGAVA